VAWEAGLEPKLVYTRQYHYVGVKDKLNFGVLNIGLFGSYAKDQQNSDSDIDLLVEFSEPLDLINNLNFKKSAYLTTHVLTTAHGRFDFTVTIWAF